MTHKVFSIYDSKAESFSTPIYFKTKGEALRSWQTVVNDEQTQFNKYPSDFGLFELGEFDQLSGQITTHKQPIPLGLAQEFQNQTQLKAVQQ